MKLFLLFTFSFTFSSSIYALEKPKGDLDELFKKQRQDRHVENKKWGEMENDCKAKFSKSYDVRSPDYDAGFECREKIEELKVEFKKKQNKETCDVAGICR